MSPNQTQIKLNVIQLNIIQPNANKPNSITGPHSKGRLKALPEKITTGEEVTDIDKHSSLLKQKQLILGINFSSTGLVQMSSSWQKSAIQTMQLWMPLNRMPI